ncbi:MAG: LysM peptidoglycan-binding domain-containing protein [Deltaproteobacteria bacterium]|nr:LysM peptidoglycan-binding domain-containing protein [Deltaproteobacteria bacterium]
MSLPQVTATGTATLAADSGPKFSEHEVRPHQTLSSIARRYGITLDELLAANPQFDRSKLSTPKPTQREGATGRNPNLIHPGEKIRIPARETRQAMPEPKPEVVSTERDQVDLRGGTPPTVTPPVQQTAPQNALAPERQTTTTTETPPPPETSEPRTQNAADPNAPRTGEAKDKDKGGGVLGFLKKLFSNPLFQGLLAVLAAIPGIGQIVSALGAVVNLTLFIGSAVSGKPDWTLLGSSLLFMAGVFMPGVGAFGGLMGMASTLDPENQKRAEQARRSQERTADAQQAERAEQNRDASETMAAVDIDAALARVRPADAVLKKDEPPEAWGRDVAALHAEYERQKALPEAQRDAARLSQLHAYFTEELPRALMTVGLELAYGSELAAPPAPGSLLPAGPARPLAEIAKAAVAGSNPPLSEAEMLVAIRAFNGLPDGATTLGEGMQLYIPTADRVRAYAQDPTKSLHFTNNEYEKFRSRGIPTLGMVTGSPLAAEINRLWGVIAKMKVTPEEYEVAWRATQHAHDMA